LFGWLKESREVLWCIVEVVSTNKTLVYLPILSRVSGNYLKLHTLKSILFSITITLGIFFIVLQTMEYLYSPVTISDSVYGSYFFLLTGFHGLHVIIGLAFLLVSYSRHILMHYGQQIKTHSVGLTTSIWYWHFVDVIWLLLFLVVYLWLDSTGVNISSIELDLSEVNLSSTESNAELWRNLSLNVNKSLARDAGYPGNLAMSMYEDFLRAAELAAKSGLRK